MRSWLHLAVLLCICSYAQAQQPLVAIHVSELTERLETIPAGAATPSGANTTGKEWWTPWWHYFVMHESLEEALRSDGTPFVVVTDSDIASGALITDKGVPRYPIVISLAAEVVSDDEITPLLNYLSSGGFLFVGSSSFTRRPDGSSRGDFALASAMGLHTMSPQLQNWTKNTTLTKVVDHRVVENIPLGKLSWTMPLTDDDVSWGTSVARKGPPGHVIQREHFVWKVKADTATVLAITSDGLPYISIQNYGRGSLIFDAAMQPLIGNGGWAPGMYAYEIFRGAIEWAFDSANLPIIRVSPWPYQYNAAYMVRHDFENTPSSIRAIEESAKFDSSFAAKGEYYFCTGTLRTEMGNSPETIDSLRRAVRLYGATIGSHNGGLPNVGNSELQTRDRDYWHWGPDELIDLRTAGFQGGANYAATSLSKSLDDIAGWMQGIQTNTRTFSAPYFNSTRDESYQILEQLRIVTAGEQKLTPFPHWTVSTRTPGRRFAFLTLPVSDWYVGSQVAQSMEVGHSQSSIRALVDHYYQLGALLNLYTHRPSNDVNPAEYIRFTSSKSNIWPVNASTLFEWWKRRSGVRILPDFSIARNTLTVATTIKGAVDPDTAVELVIPKGMSANDVHVKLNGEAAGANAYRIYGRGIKIRIGLAVSRVEVSYPFVAAVQPHESYRAVRPNRPRLLKGAINLLSAISTGRILRAAGIMALLALFGLWSFRRTWWRTSHCHTTYSE